MGYCKKHLETFLKFAENNHYELFRVFDKEGKEQPSLSVYRVFQEYNKEIIWATSQSYMSEVNNGQHLDRRCRPTAIMDGFSGIGVSQQAVDAFFTKMDSILTKIRNMTKQVLATSKILALTKNRR